MGRKSLISIQLSMLLGCVSHAPPEVHSLKPYSGGLEIPTYVTASDQKDVIVRTLTDAGFNLVDRIDQSQRVLRVTVGVNQGDKPCGSLHNVDYELRANEETVIELEAKGWTGKCHPNIFEDTSRELARTLVSRAKH